ncbi:hypothetical protein J6590_002081 [Homalodisca vitripennis]|nr:hypothetical protein J6590_002081 [Homalodisca vitripennis]
MCICGANLFSRPELLTSQRLLDILATTRTCLLSLEPGKITLYCEEIGANGGSVIGGREWQVFPREYEQIGSRINVKLLRYTVLLSPN